MLQAVKSDPDTIEEICSELHLIALAAQGAIDCGCTYDGAGALIANALFKVEDKLKALGEVKAEGMR